MVCREIGRTVRERYWETGDIPAGGSQTQQLTQPLPKGLPVMRPRPQLPQQPPTTREYSRINQTRYGLCLAFIMGFAIWYAVLTELVYQNLADGLHEEIRALVNREIVQLIKELNQIHDLIAEALTGGQKGEIEGGVTQGIIIA